MQKIAIVVTLIAAFVYYVTFAPPNKYLIDMKPVPADRAGFVNIFDGHLETNNILATAEHLLVNDINGPESFVYKNGHLYTSTIGGWVVRIEGSKVVPIAKIGDGTCDHPWKLTECGRPLGVRLNSKETFYVIDAYHGLYSIDSIDTLDQKVTQLLPLSATRHLKGGRSKFLDDITIVEGAGKSGGDVIYISDVSTKWDLSLFGNIIVEHDKSGRLLRFDTDTKQLSVVADGLVFPNGVQTMDDKNSILVCETGNQRILRVFINGPESGTTKVFANVPGACDNIRRSANPKTETYWVALPSVRNSSSPTTLVDRIFESPLIRTFMSRYFYLMGEIIETLGELFYSDALKSKGYLLKNGMVHLISYPGMIAEYDANGQIIAAYSSASSDTTNFSEVYEVAGNNGERVLYLGSFANSYLGKLVIKR